VEEALYRIAQEALNNALKHARATNVRVTIRQDAGRLRLEVGDDGLGFDAAAVRDGGGLGLHNMAERAAGVGGRLTIAAAPGKGTHIRVEVPL
jgi:signal transduction histidine kinase